MWTGPHMHVHAPIKLKIYMQSSNLLFSIFYFITFVSDRAFYVLLVETKVKIPEIVWLDVCYNRREAPAPEMTL